MTQMPPPGPPPGSPPPGPAPGWGTAPGGAPPFAPPFAPPVYQPGIVPLRPLTLGDIFGGAFAAIRRNPTATLGMAFLVTFACLLLPMLATVGLAVARVFPSPNSVADPQAGVQADVAIGLGSVAIDLFGALAALLVTGLLVRVVEQAAEGRRITIGQAWQFSRSRLLPLLGLTLLSSLVSVLVLALPPGLGALPGLAAHSLALGLLGGFAGLLLGLVALAFVYTRFLLLAPAILVLEGAGVGASIRRSGRLVRGQFWRIFGIYLLASIVAGVVGQVLGIPFTLVGGLAPALLPGSWASAGTLLGSCLARLVTGTITQPFTGCVLVLLYLDQRFRKEGHDIELLDRTLGRSGVALDPRAG